MKTCTKCRESKDESEFNRSRATKDGFQYWCRSCSKAYFKNRYEQYPELMRSQNNKHSRTWQKKNPDYCRNWRERNPAKIRSYGRTSNRKRYKLSASVRAKAQKNNQRWHQQNPTKGVEYRNRRRAHKRNNIIEPYEREEIYERDGGLCFCGEHADPYAIDHFVPITKSGADASWNVRVVHKSCNSSKRNTMPTIDEMVEWMEYLESVDEDSDKFVDAVTA